MNANWFMGIIRTSNFKYIIFTGVISFIFAAASGVAMPSRAAEIDLNGRWESSYSGEIIEVRHTGNTVVGGDSFRGTLSGYNFSGEIRLTADGCPNLEGFAPATGMISTSQNTITFTTDKAFHFLTKECAKTGEEYTDSTSYTRIRAESLPAPTAPPSVEIQQPIEEPREKAVTESQTPFGYEGCVNVCNVEMNLFQEYCNERDTRKQKELCNRDAEYATEQCMQNCYVNYQLPKKISIGNSNGRGGQLSFNFPTAQERAIDRITEGKSGEFWQKSREEQNRIVDEYLEKNPITTQTFTLPNGKPIEIDIRDIPIVNAVEGPLTAVANNDVEAISKINARWLNAEGTFLYDPIFKRYQSLADIRAEGEAYDELYPGGSRKFVGPTRLFEFSFATLPDDRPLLFPSGGCCQITYGTDKNGRPITDPGTIVTVTRQIIKIQDTAAAIGGNSQVTLTGADSVELGRGNIQIKRPDAPSQSSFNVKTPLGTAVAPRTNFWVAYNPIKGYTLVGVWEGVVSVTHAFTDETTMLEPQENGEPGIMILLQPEVEARKIGPLGWIAIILIICGFGYLAYRKKNWLLSLLKRESQG